MPKKHKIKKFDKGGLLSEYENYSEKYPLAKLSLDLVPVTGVATSAVDTVSDLKKGNYGKAAIDALGVIPGVKTIKTAAEGLRKASTVKKYDSPLWEAARNVDRGSDISEAQSKQERNTKEKKKQNVAQSMGKKKGGVIRGCGCEQRGKTRGRFV